MSEPGTGSLNLQGCSTTAKKSGNGYVLTLENFHHQRPHAI